MARQSENHERGPARAARRRAPPCMWRGPGMELSDELYAQQPSQGPRGGRGERQQELFERAAPYIGRLEIPQRSEPLT